MNTVRSYFKEHTVFNHFDGQTKAVLKRNGPAVEAHLFDS
jgi:hypothetical protein